MLQGSCSWVFLSGWRGVNNLGAQQLRCNPEQDVTIEQQMAQNAGEIEELKYEEQVTGRKQPVSLTSTALLTLLELSPFAPHASYSQVACLMTDGAPFIRELHATRVAFPGRLSSCSRSRNWTGLAGVLGSPGTGSFPVLSMESHIRQRSALSRGYLL